MDRLSPGTHVGHYRVGRQLGRGGMASVYEATHEATGRPVALKILSSELGSERDFAARFRREGMMQAALDHPHAVTVYEAGESAHGLYLAMELVPGPPLAALVLDGVLGAERALTVLGQVASALDAAHAAGLVHRDVKPKNVLVGEGDHAYLADFGLTKLGGESGLTVTGGLMGTLAYLSPEVIRGEPATTASDVYAFTAMVFECLTGGPVFPRQTQAAQLFAHTSEPAPRATGRRAELPASLDEVLAQGLAKRPEDRPRSAVALMESVAGALEEVDLALLGPPAPPGDDAFAGDTTLTPGTVDMPARAETRPAPGRARTAALVAAAALGGAVIGAGIAILADKDTAADTEAPPPALAGSTVLGSDLLEPGAPRDCRGRTVSTTSPGCTIAQLRLPGQRIVVPAPGVIRRWSVRSALGEIALAVLRPREGRFFQIALSSRESVDDERVHTFASDLGVERGDVLALRVVPGSGTGLRPAAGATTNRWLPVLGGLPQVPDRGVDGEVLLRAELLPGRDVVTRQITGQAAAGLPAGSVLKRSGGRISVALVTLSDGVALDLFARGKRLSRQYLPGFLPGNGRVIVWEVLRPPANEPPRAEVYIEYVNEDSGRILTHYVVAHAREFEYIS
jgi:serine/threonine-protein kinase